jgi:hypothetical protein
MTIYIISILKYVSLPVTTIYVLIYMYVEAVLIQEYL